MTRLTGRHWSPLATTLVRVAGAVAAVAASTAILTRLGADLAVAVSVLFLVVVGLAGLGYVPGLTAAAMSFGALNYYFTPPFHSFAVDRTDDLVALLVFVIIAIVVAATVARLNDLRSRSAVGEREAQLRLQFTNRVITGAAPGPVLEAAARELVEVFQLSCCRVESDFGHFSVGVDAPGSSALTVSQPGLGVLLERPRRFSTIEADTIQALVLSLASVLERVRLDAEARELRVHDEVARSRTAFLTAVTHDLRTPLATIRASTGALMMSDSQVDTTGRRELLQLAHGEAARLERLVGNVLDISRIRAGALQPHRVAVDAADLVRAAVERIGPLGEGRAIDLDIDVEMPALYVDPGMLERVVSNLLENAVLHARTRSPIEVRACARGATLELRVIDHGKGIPVEERGRVFDEFTRSNNAESRHGTGLGLAIVRALVDANGGHASYEETPGGGATFVLVLPVVTGDEA